jgi:hypothetical protein
LFGLWTAGGHPHSIVFVRFRLVSDLYGLPMRLLVLKLFGSRTKLLFALHHLFSVVRCVATTCTVQSREAITNDNDRYHCLDCPRSCSHRISFRSIKVHPVSGKLRGEPCLIGP